MLQHASWSIHAHKQELLCDNIIKYFHSETSLTTKLGTFIMSKQGGISVQFTDLSCDSITENNFTASNDLFKLWQPYIDEFPHSSAHIVCFATLV